MKHIPIVLTLGLLASGCGINGNGNIISEVRSVREFEGVELSVSVDTYLEVSDIYAVTITCDSNLVSRINTTVNDRVLEIDTSRWIDAGSECFFTVEAPYFDRLVVNGSGDLQYDAAAPVESIYARVNGSGDLGITGIDSDHVSSAVAGSGTISLSGTTHTMKARTDGSGDIWARELLAKSVDAATHGSGDIEVYASIEVVASTHGSGDITVYGAPASTDVSTEGSGDVRFK